MQKRVALLSLSLIFLTGCTGDVKYIEPKNKVSREEYYEVKDSVDDKRAQIVFYSGEKDFYIKLKGNHNYDNKLSRDYDYKISYDDILIYDSDEQLVYVKRENKEIMYQPLEDEVVIVNLIDKTYTETKFPILIKDEKWINRNIRFAANDEYHYFLKYSYFDYSKNYYPQPGEECFYIDSNIYTRTFNIKVRDDNMVSDCNAKEQCIEKDNEITYYVDYYSSDQFYRNNEIVKYEIREYKYRIKHVYCEQKLKKIDLKEYKRI